MNRRSQADTCKPWPSFIIYWLITVRNAVNWLLTIRKKILLNKSNIMKDWGHRKKRAIQSGEYRFSVRYRAWTVISTTCAACKSLLTCYQECKHSISRKMYQPQLIAQTDLMGFLYPDIEKYLVVLCNKSNISMACHRLFPALLFG